MSFEYLGYDLQVMLSFIGQFSDKLTLEYDGSEWILNIIDSNLGDQEKRSAAITRCVVEAFKPYKNMADKCRSDFKITIAEIATDRHREKFENMLKEIKVTK